MGFRGAAPMIKHFSDLSFGAVPRGMGISVEVEDYAWIRRIVEKENLARSSSDCVVISGEVEACTRICVERGGSGRWRETCRWVGVTGR